MTPSQKSKFNEGKAERNIEIVTKMLIKKRSIEEIHEITELPMKEIQKLKDEIEK